MLEEIKKSFLDQYATEPSLIIRAPGRINLIGEHTDYNMGLVFPAAIDKSMYFAFKPNETDQIRITALDKEQSVSLDIHNLSSDILWAKYCIGVLKEFIKLDVPLVGFDLLFKSDIPIGAGVSSSAALECGFAMGVKVLSKVELEPWEIARIGNRAENEYLGIGSGILDQFSSMFGKKDQAMLMNCATQEFDYYPVDIDPYTLVLINTNVKHSNLSSGYNDRPAECAEILQTVNEVYPEISFISELSIEQLVALKHKLSSVLYDRAHFILEENMRVLAFKEALLANDFNTLGSLLLASHAGLKNKYEVSCRELDLLVQLSQTKETILGARMMGGGFGGCTLNLIHKENLEETIEDICQHYKSETGIEASPYYVKISEGVELLLDSTL